MVKQMVKKLAQENPAAAENKPTPSSLCGSLGCLGSHIIYLSPTLFSK